MSSTPEEEPERGPLWDPNADLGEDAPVAEGDLDPAEIEPEDPLPDGNDQEAHFQEKPEDADDRDAVRQVPDEEEAPPEEAPPVAAAPRPRGAPGGVQFHRVLKQGMHGKDVGAVQRTLHQLGFRNKIRTGRYGAATERQVKEYQQRRDLRVTGNYNEPTHEKLRRQFDSYANYLYRLEIEKSKRHHIAATALFGYRNRYSIHYTQGGLRMYGVRNRIRPPHVPRFEDCSSFATWCYWVADAPDPNGFGYNGYGFTGTQTANGTRVDHPAEGDLVFYGRPNVTHVAIYVGDSKVVSHGSEGGPYLASMWYRSDVNQCRSYI